MHSHLEDSVNISGARGIMFYVDLSGVTPKDDSASLCASVSLNNLYSRGDKREEENAVAWYYANGEWLETTNINDYRYQLPVNFQGWVYIPASSFIGTEDSSAVYENGKFTDLEISSVGCYADGYKYSADDIVIFDEISLVY